MVVLATLCYLRKGDQTLMLERVKKINDVHRGKWNGLGGKVEPGEAPEECVIREVYEESGLLIEAPKLVGLLTFPNFTPQQDWYVYCYTADQFSGTLKECAEGNLAWKPTHSLLELPLWDGDRFFLQWIAAERFFSAKFTYREGTLKNFSVVFS